MLPWLPAPRLATTLIATTEPLAPKRLNQSLSRLRNERLKEQRDAIEAQGKLPVCRVFRRVVPMAPEPAARTGVETTEVGGLTGPAHGEKNPTRRCSATATASVTN